MDDVFKYSVEDDWEKYKAMVYPNGMTTEQETHVRGAFVAAIQSGIGFANELYHEQEKYEGREDEYVLRANNKLSEIRQEIDRLATVTLFELNNEYVTPLS